MRILVTGGTGFIGGPTIKALSAKELEVVLAVYPGDAGFVPDGVKTIPVNLLDPEGRATFLAERGDILLHMAWYAAPNAFWRSEKNLDWLTASVDLCRAFADQGGKRLVVTGTCAEYDWSEGGVMDEASTPTRPSTLYGVCKNSLREVVHAYAQIREFGFAWARIFWPYGPGEPDGRLVKTLFTDLLAGRPATCRAGNLNRDYIHANDIGAALAELCLSSCDGVVNIGSGSTVSLGELSTRVAELVGRPDLLTVLRTETGYGNPETVVASTRRLKDEVGFAPAVGLDEGLREMHDMLIDKH